MYKTSVQSHGFRIYYKSGMLFIDLPSGRRLVYVNDTPVPFNDNSLIVKKWCIFEVTISEQNKKSGNHSTEICAKVATLPIKTAIFHLYCSILV